MLAIVFTALTVLFKVATSLIGIYITMLEARTKGALAYAGYYALNSAVLQVTFLFTLAAFALFCMAAGSCLPVKAESTTASQGAGKEDGWYGR